MADGDDADDKVGYGRPPRRHQFKPGQSGNPKGRPKKALKGVSVHEILSEPVSLNGKKRPFPEVYVKVMKKRSLDGDRQAVKIIMDLLRESNLINPKQEIDRSDWFEDATVRLEAKLRALSRRRAGIEEDQKPNDSGEGNKANEDE